MLESLFIRVFERLFDTISNSSFKLKKKEDATSDLYYNAYEPIFIELTPFFRNYNDGEPERDALVHIRNILNKHHAVINPAHIVRINKIIDENGNLMPYQNNNSKKMYKKYLKKNDIERQKADKEYRQKKLFSGLYMNFSLNIIKLSVLKKIGSFTISQKNFNRPSIF